MCEEIEFEIQEEDIPLTMNLEDDVYLVEPKTESLEVTPTKETQYFESETGIYYGNITVNPIPDEYIIPDGNLEINQNGTYDVNNYSSAEVNVPEKVLGTKTITTNGTYNATDDNLDGYSKVEVATSGVDINDYFETDFEIQPYSINTVGYWIFSIKKIPTISKIIQNAEYLFGHYKGSSLDVSNLDISQVTNMKYMFYFCSELTSLDLSSFNTSKVTNMRDCFYNCKKLTRLDIRNFDFTNVTSYSSMFGIVPTDCLIIVKDDTAKTWITEKFTTLTNVKTVAELEAA